MQKINFVGFQRLIWIIIFSLCEIISVYGQTQEIVIHNISQKTLKKIALHEWKMKVISNDEVGPGETATLSIESLPGFWFKDPPDANFLVQYEIDNAIVEFRGLWEKEINFDKLTDAKGGYVLLMDVLNDEGSSVNIVGSNEKKSPKKFSSYPYLISITDKRET
tara:strand:- start:366 stop:857 length:492 start_codon:yes stop_codon:yes gene_type:complete